MRKECVDLLKRILFSICSNEVLDDKKTAETRISKEEKRYISILLEDDHIQKVEDQRGYTVTRKGIEKLEEELDCFVLKGKIESGMGEGGYYISRKGYKTQFRGKFDIDPYEGTLNVNLSPSSLSRWEELRGIEGTKIDGFKEDGETFGSIKAFSVNICSLEGILIIPEKSDYDRTIEVVSRFHLKDKLDLEDGDEVVMLVDEHKKDRVLE